ncbi:ATP-binding protein [Bacillus suaedaesalsae]|uniref:histidine kinase n=1 Tax=Bacillus suaedaesalsae TaxID=2810349 RepID=A0ABS2DGN6_9BACI|nr:ATP-binding protein [Bacillus suaedaesalsae]MBM6617642.1 response regulator [Bacillus suaedaesalsae]
MFFYQEYINNHYSELNQINEEKEKIAQDLDNSFNKLFFETRGFIAYEEEPYLNRALTQRQIIDDSLRKLETFKRDSSDEDFYKYVSSFHHEYINTILPQIIEDIRTGNKDKVKEEAVGGLSDRVLEVQNTLRIYRLEMDQNVENNFDELSEKVHQSQLFFLVYLFSMIILLAWLTRMMLSKIGGPLNDFAKTADLLSQGKEVNYDFNSNRKDELGVLSRAFGKMILSIQDNEQQLVAQNEELQAQQYELQVQHIELENALDILRKNETELLNRNEFINNLSSSLIKEYVLVSIVKNMSNILHADNGFIGFLTTQDYAVFGISHEKGRQILETLSEGPARRVIDTKKPYIVRREASNLEKGYHEVTLYCSDLYVPILNVKDEVQAVMRYTKLGTSFLKNDIKESEALAKQISISLERIELYEESEHDRLLTQNMLNTIHEGIQLVDVTGKLLQVNTNLCDLISCEDASTLVGNELQQWLGNILEIVENPSALKTFYESVLSGNYQNTSFIYHIHKPEEKVIQVYCEPLERGTDRFGTLFVHRDITREYEVDQMKSEFVSTVSHELRTPLASVLGFTELLIHKELKPDRQKKYLQTIYQEAKRLTGLINDFLDVQRMEAGKQSYEKVQLDLIPILLRNIETMQIHAATHPISVNIHTDKTMVFGDQDKLSQVFTNIISNAIKYSPEGGDIDIDVYEKNNFLHVSVKDKGLGIPDEAIPMLFTKFYRVDNSDRRRIGGTGLGLAIVKEIMKAHDGDISVSSELKKGSIFTLQFPFSSPVDKLETRDISHYESSIHDRKDIYVVIVEDDDSLASLLQAELNESGFTVKHVSTAEDAIESFKIRVPDSIVVDILLNEKGLDGWGLIDYMKSKTQLKDIPIFISSALEEKERAQKIGARDFLVKPYQPSKLTKTILHTLLKQDRMGQIMVPEVEKE